MSIKKIYDAKQRKLTAGKGQVVTGRKVRSERSKEGKLSVGQTEPKGTKIVDSGERKTFHWRMPQAKGHQSLKGSLSNYPGHGPTGR